MWACLTQIVSGIDYVVMIVVLAFDDDTFYLDTLVVVTILRLQSFSNVPSDISKWLWPASLIAKMFKLARNG